MLSIELFTALVDANAPGDPEYVWVPIEIEDYLVQPGVVGVNILKEEYNFHLDISQRIKNAFPDSHPEDIAIIFVQKGSPSILEMSDVCIHHEEDNVKILR